MSIDTVSMKKREMQVLLKKIQDNQNIPYWYRCILPSNTSNVLGK